MKLLFICNQNRLRSPTAEKVFSAHAGVEARSAGINKDATIPVTRDLLEWADKIFVMEKRQRNIIRKQYPDIYKSKAIICLYIQDQFEYMDPELVSLLEERVKTHLVSG